VKHKILIANRGEIAVRIIQACVKLGLDFVCVYTDVDKHSAHCALAKKLGRGKSLYAISSYLDANEIFAVADASGATAVHPGYGFFAEDYRFARRAVQRKRKIIFIGPSWQVIRELGDKINTKRLARRLGVPTVPGSDRPMHDEIEAEELAKNLFAFQHEQGIANPVVLVKASAGGGGMGIEEVDDFDKFRTVLRSIRNYAKRQFRDDGVLIEQRIFDFNHLEVQIVADRSGKNIVHYGTRNCTIQSTGRQKRLEVAPGFDPTKISYAFDAKRVMTDITEYSLRMAREVGYDNVEPGNGLSVQQENRFSWRSIHESRWKTGFQPLSPDAKIPGKSTSWLSRYASVLAMPLDIPRRISPLKALESNTASLPKIRKTALPHGSGL
jgi:acetyl/propionyl-CoA carboxylase alpha subunit